MIILKSIIHDVATNWLEATWVDRIQLPDVEVPESFGATTRAEDGSIIPGELIPAHTIKGRLQDTQVKCHSYADVQMDMLRADAAEMGTPLDAFEPLLAEILAQLSAIDVKRIRPLAEGDTGFLQELNKKALSLRNELKTL